MPAYRPNSSTIFALIAGTTHLYALIAFGAVFWIDAEAYAALGESLKAAEGLRGFYSGVGIWFYSHLQPGLALVWLGLDLLPTSWQWPVLAVLQHALAAFALYEFFLAVHRRWPSRWNFLGCAFVGCLPFYQAAHNSFMTESISSSLLLIGLALALKISGEPTFARKRLLALLAVVVAVTHFAATSACYWPARVRFFLLARRCPGGASWRCCASLSRLARWRFPCIDSA